MWYTTQHCLQVYSQDNNFISDGFVCTGRGNSSMLSDFFHKFRHIDSINTIHILTILTHPQQQIVHWILFYLYLIQFNII